MARPHPRVLLGNAFLFVVASSVSAIVHQLGHAFAGRVLGLRVWRIVVGAGPMLVKRKLFGTELHFGAIPIGGLTYLHPENQAALRLRYWLAIAAGPAMTAALLALGVSQRESISLAHGIAPLQMLALANGIILLSVLIPLRLSGGIGLQATDGAQLLRLPFLPRERIREMLSMRSAIDIVEALDQGNDRRALERVETALCQFPESLVLASLKASAHLALHEFERARELFVELAARPDLDHGQRLVVQNNLAWTNLQLGDAALLAEANVLWR